MPTSPPHFVPKNPPFERKMYQSPPPRGFVGTSWGFWDIFFWVLWYILAGGPFWYILGGFLVQLRVFQVHWGVLVHFVWFLSHVFWAVFHAYCPQEVAVLGLEI